MHVCAQLLNCVRLFATPWIVACQAPLSMEFPRQEYWSGMSFPTQGDLPDSGIKPASLVSPVLAGRFFTTVPPGKPTMQNYSNMVNNQIKFNADSTVSQCYSSAELDSFTVLSDDASFMPS